MKPWPFSKRRKKDDVRQEVEDVKRRQRRVELELRTLAVQANRHRSR